MSSPSQMPLEARGLGQAFFNITSFLSRTERFGTVPWTESSRPMRRTRKDQVVALVSLSIAEFDVDCLLARHLSGPLCQVVGSFWKQQEVSPYFPTSLCGVLVFWLPSRPTPPVLPSVPPSFPPSTHSLHSLTHSLTRSLTHSLTHSLAAGCPRGRRSIQSL